MLIVPAHAKLNLGLAVLGGRSDGYHDLDSVAVPLDWHDIVGVELGGHGIQFSGEGANALIDHPGELATRAADAAAAAADVAVSVWLDKRLPQAAGLGGGSADAAAVLRAVEKALALTGAIVDRAAMWQLAASLGSDVPACYAQVPVRLRGRGDDLTLLPSRTHLIVVAICGVSSTAATYAAVRPADFEDGDRIEQLAAALTDREIPDWLLGSGLEAAARRCNPMLGDALDELRRHGGDARWHLTGSGGAAFALARDPEHAQRLRDVVSTRGFAARICRTLAHPFS